MVQHPFDQSTYQVRFEWGAKGLARLAPTDIVVLVDVLGFSTAVIRSIESGDDQAQDAATRTISTAAGTGALVLLGGLRNAAAVAAAIHGEQERRGERTSIAVIACGDVDVEALRFAVEDQLGAGAIIDALGAIGIDHTSPEAAATGESFRALRRAATHLLTASGSGRELIDAGHRDEVVAAAQVDAASIVPVLRGETFRRL